MEQRRCYGTGFMNLKQQWEQVQEQRARSLVAFAAAPL
jgi:hypothetical protein